MPGGKATKIIIPHSTAFLQEVILQSQLRLNIARAVQDDRKSGLGRLKRSDLKVQELS